MINITYAMYAYTYVLDIRNIHENDTCKPQDNSEREWEGRRQDVRASVVNVSISGRSLKGEKRET